MSEYEDDFGLRKGTLEEDLLGENWDEPDLDELDEDEDEDELEFGQDDDEA